MTEIKKMENELKNFHKGTDYSVSGNRKSGILYTIHSDNLKQSLRDIIHSGASNEEWQIGHTFGQDGIEYAMERDNNFVVYRKSLNADYPDGLAVLNTNQPQDSSSQVWQRREKFIQSVQNIERSRQIVEESRARNELRQRGGGIGFDNYVAYSSSRNEKGERVIRKEERYSGSEGEKELKEGYGYSLANEIVAELSKQKGNVFSEIGRERIEDNLESSTTPPQRSEKFLSELEKELSYLKSLPDKKGYLKKNIQDLERQITELKQRQNFTPHHQIPPKSK